MKIIRLLQVILLLSLSMAIVVLVLRDRNMNSMVHCSTHALGIANMIVKDGRFSGVQVAYFYDSTTMVNRVLKTGVKGIHMVGSVSSMEERMALNDLVISNNPCNLPGGWVVSVETNSIAIQ